MKGNGGPEDISTVKGYVIGCHGVPFYDRTHGGSQMISVYEKALRLHRLHAQNLISAVLRHRFQSLNTTAILPPHHVDGWSDIHGSTDGLKRTKPARKRNTQRLDRSGRVGKALTSRIQCGLMISLLPWAIGDAWDP